MRLHSAWKRLNRGDRLGAGVLIVLVCLIFYPLLMHLVRGTMTDVPFTDHPAHNTFAAEMRQQRVVSMPHPLYHLAVIGVQAAREVFRPPATAEPDARAAIASAGKEMQGPELAAINQLYASASILVLMLFLNVLALILWAQVRAACRTDGAISVVMGILIVLGIMVAAPIAIFLSEDHKFYFGYIGINVWHSPTVLVAKPFALITFALVAHMLGDPPSGQLREENLPPIRRHGYDALTALVVVIGALAKPSFLLALIPATVAMSCYRRIFRKVNIPWQRLVFVLVLPAAIVLMWQGRIYANLTGGSHAKFAPFATVSTMSDRLGAKFWLSIVFPVVGYLASGAAVHCRWRLNLAWVTFLCGAALTYLIAESRRTSHGNFLWSAQLALFVLFTETVVCVIAATRSRWKDPAGRRWAGTVASVCGIVFTIHVGYGIAYYLHLMETPNTTMLLYK